MHRPANTNCLPNNERYNINMSKLPDLYLRFPSLCTCATAMFIFLSHAFLQADDFSDRCHVILHAAAQERKADFFTLTAGIRLGRNDYSRLDSLLTDERISGSFLSYSAISSYLYLQAVLPDSLKLKIRELYRRRTIYRGDTENHWLMYYTGLYLAGQTWPNETGERWFNGKSSMENFNEAREYLAHWIEIATTIGQGEFDSPTYFITYVTPLLALYDFCLDPIMKHRAEMMLHLLFADFAIDHLQGMYGGGHSRDYPEDIINPLIPASTMFSWLYFGQPDFPPWQERRGKLRHRGWETVFASLSHYRLPDIIRHIATDRSKSYASTETRRVRNVIRFGKELNPAVYKYTWMTADYVMGSLQGGILQPIQQHTWDISFVSEQPYNTLFTLHPCYSGKELAMFFPEEQKILTDEVNRYHLIYKDPDKWNSSSPYEQTFQYKNCLLVLYHIESSAQHQHIDGFFPKTLKQRLTDPSGWIFCDAGRTYIAFFPLQPYEWIEEEHNWRWRSTARQNGVVVQAESRDQSSSFAAFTKKFTAVPQLDNSMTLRYRTCDGDSMRFTYDGARWLNAKPVDFKQYQFFNSPYITSEYGSRVINLQYKKQKLVLDFNKDWETQ
jgi:hypothetical protein